MVLARAAYETCTILYLQRQIHSSAPTIENFTQDAEKREQRFFHGKRYKKSETETHESIRKRLVLGSVSKLKLALPQPSVETEAHSDPTSSSSSSVETDTDSNSESEEETSDGSDDEMQTGCESTGNRVFDIAALDSALTQAANCCACGSTGTLQVRSDFTARNGIVVRTF